MAWPPSHGQDGWIDLWTCVTPNCQLSSCPSRNRQAQTFNVCKPAGTCPDLWVMWTCEDGYISRSYYSGWPCSGKSDYIYPYLHDCKANHFGADFFKPDICGPLGDENPNSWVTARCGLVPPEFRDSELSENAQINAGIAVVVLLIVCMIGVISGYLVYRKKKKSAEKEKKLLRQSMQRHATETL